MSDYHVHLHPHEPRGPADPLPGEYPPGHIERYVEAAAARGAPEVGFTEHLFRCVESEAPLGPFWEKEPNELLARQALEYVTLDRNLSLEAYAAAITAAKERGLPVLLGLEVDFFPDTIDAALELIAPYPWDFLIGSVHWVGGWSIDHGHAVDEFERRGVERAYEDYFEIEAALAGSGAVDVLAHVDVVKKFGHSILDPVPLYEQVVKAAVASGVAVEVSSSGLHLPAAEIYPAPRFLRMFGEAGVPITLASDAHYPHQAARGYDEVRAAARAAGYTQRLRFAGRRSEGVPL